MVDRGLIDIRSDRDNGNGQLLDFIITSDIDDTAIDAIIDKNMELE
jgi:hypothetical protein